MFNFHPVKSFADYSVGVNHAGTYKIILNSDDVKFGGLDRVDVNVLHITKPEHFATRSHRMMVYIPCRTAIIYAKGKKF